MNTDDEEENRTALEIRQVNVSLINQQSEVLTLVLDYWKQNISTKKITNSTTNSSPPPAGAVTAAATTPPAAAHQEAAPTPPQAPAVAQP